MYMYTRVNSPALHMHTLFLSPALPISHSATPEWAPSGSEGFAPVGEGASARASRQVEEPSVVSAPLTHDATDRRLRRLAEGRASGRRCGCLFGLSRRALGQRCGMCLVMIVCVCVCFCMCVCVYVYVCARACAVTIVLDVYVYAEEKWQMPRF